MHSLAQSLASAMDPSRILYDAGMSPDPWQAKALANWQRDHLFLCSRQSGKSLTAAALAVWFAVFQPGATVLLVSRAERQSGELFRTCQRLYSDLPYAPVLRVDSATVLETVDRARILALPGSEATVRGISAASAIIIDEAARVEDELIAATTPMLATTAGPLWALTTPFGARGWFYRRWTQAKDVERVKITAKDCPRISPAWLEKQRAELADWEYRAEYECEFVSDDSAVFTGALIGKMFSPEVQPLWA